MPKRIAVLASGSGSNLEALLIHLDQLGQRRSGVVALVISNRADAGALQRARARGIPAVHITDHDDATAWSRLLDAHGIDLIVLAGYLKLVPAAITDRFRGRMLNVHPAPLPAFGGRGMYGLRAHRAVLASGTTMSGPTVHFVDDRYDHGPIIAHTPVPVIPGESPESLSERVLCVEHLLYPVIIDAVAGGRISLDATGHVVTGPDEATFLGLLATSARNGSFGRPADDRSLDH